MLRFAPKPELRARSGDKTGTTPPLGKRYMFVNHRDRSLPIPTRDEILNSPMQEHGSTSGFTVPHDRPHSPVMDDPSEALERELAGTHLGGMRR